MIIKFIHGLGCIIFTIGLILIMSGCVNVAASPEGHSAQLDNAARNLGVGFICLIVGGILIGSTDNRYLDEKIRRIHENNSK